MAPAGFRHLVDSSLDWGQDLPALKQYLDRHPPQGPVYLSYFGNASPAYYRIPARFIRSDPGLFQKDQGAFEVRLVPSSQGAAAIAALTGQLPDYEQVGTAASGANTAVFLLKKPAGLRLTGGTGAATCSNTGTTSTVNITLSTDRAHVGSPAIGSCTVM